MNIVVALGGNAILQEGEKGTYAEQMRNISSTAAHLVKLVKHGNNVVITHGNGPQVGDILLRYELSKNQLPVMPLHVCGGESQGMLGYMISQAMSTALAKAGVKKDVACILTRTIVDTNDNAFKRPSKPIGPFYTKYKANALSKKYGWSIVQEGKMYRRVVPSPKPVEILELDTIKNIIANGTVLVCTGGGGVPVVWRSGVYTGIDAVIDKDLSSSLLAKKLDADMFIILTDVKNVMLDYGKKTARRLSRISSDECYGYLSRKKFEEGTMAPKIRAAADFASFTGRHAVITSIENAEKAVLGKAGTIIYKHNKRK